MPTPSRTKMIMRSTFSWKMLFMLIGSTIVFGGIFWAVAARFSAMQESFASMPVPVINVTAAKAAAQDWSVEVPAIGVLEARRGVNITSSVPGLVQQILFESGNQVLAGQLLVRLDADVERANMASAQAAMKLAKANLARGESLRSTDNISKATLEQRQSEFDAAAAQMASFSAQIEKKTITAPFDGVLGIRKINVGGYVEAGDPIVNVQDLSAMLVDFSVSQKELSDHKVGQEIRMTTDAYPVKEFFGKLSAIEPLINQQTGMVEVQGYFDNTDGRLRSGMFAKLAIILPTRISVVTVPRSAISYSLYGDYVYVTKESKSDQGEAIVTVERRIVKSGERRNNLVTVNEGLAAGEIVITSGQIKLDSGTRVAISETGSLTPPAEIPAE